MLGLRLVSLHNQAFLIGLMRRAREAIIDGTFESWSTSWLARYHAGNAQRQRPMTSAG
jgi:queuine tRNA-ribosyltransferase